MKSFMSLSKTLIGTSGTLGLFALAEPALAACPAGQTEGVITECTHSTFPEYVKAVLTEDMKYVILAAVIMIAYSGIQYMLAGTGSSELQKQAKTRIFGILGGVILLMLITLIINQIEPNISTM